MNMGVKIAGGNPAHGRRENDFYATPPECVTALLDRWPLEGSVWEPMAGDGVLVEAMRDRGLEVFAGDLHDRGAGAILEDFLAVEVRRASTIVTNPPYKLAAEVIRHAHALGVSRLALLLKSTFWHAAKRHDLYLAHRPRWIFPLLWRPDYTGQGGATMEAAWVVWEGATAEHTEYEPLPRPRTV